VRGNFFHGHNYSVLSLIVDWLLYCRGLGEGVGVDGVGIRLVLCDAILALVVQSVWRGLRGGGAGEGGPYAVGACANLVLFL
jgi:hypothetical protein